MRALTVVVFAMLWACGPSFGGDPHDAPGCEFLTRRCDGDVVQLCQYHAGKRHNTWWDIDNCGELAAALETDLVCVEGDSERPAHCEDVEDGKDDDANAAESNEPSCPTSTTSCDGEVLRICSFDAELGREAWRDVLDCADFGGRFGEEWHCVESAAEEGVADCEASEARNDDDE